MNSLEAQFGVELLKRTHQGVEPTEAGKTLFAYGQRMLTLTQGLSEEMARLTGNSPQRLVVGASTGVGGYALPCSIYLFKEKHPESDVSLVVSSTDDVLQQLEDRQIRVGLVEGPVEPGPELAAAVLSEDELVLIVPPKGVWEGRDEVAVEDLKQQPLLIREDGSGTRHTLESALAVSNMKLSDFKVTMEINSLDAIKASVEAGQGVSLVSRLVIRKELRHGTLRAVALRGLSLPYRCTMLYPKTGQKTRLESQFIRFMRASRERDFC